MINYLRFQRDAARLHMRDVADKTWLHQATHVDLIVFLGCMVVAVVAGWLV